MDRKTPLVLTQKEFPRRVFLAEGTRLLTLGGLGALAGTLAWPELGMAQDWKALSKTKLEGGHGTVKEVKGRATAASRPLKKGSRVESGEQIQVARDGLVILSLSDNTIMRINGNTTLTLEIGRNRQGFFKLLAGSLLTVMPTRNRYLVKLPTAVIGIKGTVFFQQIYHPEERTAMGMENKSYTIPEGISEYFCLCNGTADFTNAKTLGTFFTDKADHHNSYYIDPSKENPLVKAPMLNHVDEEIRQLIQLQDGPKHKSGFLDKYESQGP